MEVEEAGWEFMFGLVDRLGIDGMSSDESEPDDDRGRSYRAKRRTWRSKALEKYLRRIDKDYNSTNAYGNARAGTNPRVRNRPACTDSAGEAVRGLPRNFYDPNWFRKLSLWDRKDLEPASEVELMELEWD